MSEVRVQHHVFSSDGGYRTTFASPDLTPEMVKVLETAASAEQTVFSAGPAHACLRLESGHVVVCRTFVHGADHVGRKRLCSHSILLPGAVRRLEGFNSATPPDDLFMDTEVPAERPGPYLVASWDVPEGDVLRQLRERARVALEKGGHATEVLAGLLAPSRTLVVAGPLNTGFTALGRAAWLLPPEVRQGLSYRVGSWRPEQLQAAGEVSAVVVPDVGLLDDYRGGEFITVDLTAGSFAEQPRESYAAYLTSMAASPRGADRVATFLSYLTAFPGPQRPSRDQLACLVQAYRLMEPALMAPALAEVLERSTPRLIGALCPLAKSGREGMARWLVGQLDEVVSRLERPVLKEAMEALRREQAGNFFLKSLDLGRLMAAYGQRLREAATGNSSPH